MSSSEFLNDAIHEDHIESYDNAPNYGAPVEYGMKTQTKASPMSPPVKREIQPRELTTGLAPQSESAIREANPDTLKLAFHTEVTLEQLASDEKWSVMKAIQAGVNTKIESLIRGSMANENIGKQANGKPTSSLSLKQNQSQELPKILVTQVILTDIKSTFKCAVGLELTGIAGNSPTEVSSAGRVVNYIVNPGTSFSNKHIVIMNAPQNSEIPFLQNFPGWTVHNIDEGIVPVPGESYSLARNDHPVTFFVKSACKTPEEMARFEENKIGQHYKVDANNVNTIMKLLKADMTDGIPLTTPEGVGIKLVRAFAPVSNSLNSDEWLHESEIFSGVNKDSATIREGVLKGVNTFYCKLQVKYRVP